MMNEFVLVRYRKLSVRLLKNSWYTRRLQNAQNTNAKEQILEEAFRNGDAYGFAVWCK